MVPDGTKPQPEPLMAKRQWDIVAPVTVAFSNETAKTSLFKRVRNLLNEGNISHFVVCNVSGGDLASFGARTFVHRGQVRHSHATRDKLSILKCSIGRACRPTRTTVLVSCLPMKALLLIGNRISSTGTQSSKKLQRFYKAGRTPRLEQVMVARWHALPMLLHAVWIKNHDYYYVHKDYKICCAL